MSQWIPCSVLTLSSTVYMRARIPHPSLAWDLSPNTWKLKPATPSWATSLHALGAACRLKNFSSIHKNKKINTSQFMRLFFSNMKFRTCAKCFISSISRRFSPALPLRSPRIEVQPSKWALKSSAEGIRNQRKLDARCKKLCMNWVFFLNTIISSLTFCPLRPTILPEEATQGNIRWQRCEANKQGDARRAPATRG